MLEFFPAFPLGKNIDQGSFYWFKNQFPDASIDKIFEYAAAIPETTATIVDKNANQRLENDVRISSIKWMNPSIENQWIYETLMNLTMEANQNMWGFDLNHIRDAIQYTEYHAGNDESEHGKYDWHMDIGPFPYNHRKVSITVQLSDPNDYEGGDLEIWCGKTYEKLPRFKGATCLFPSYLMHRVTPVTKGVRKSLVLWVGGSSFR
jgi:PKHD-type hydroxylase